VKDGKGSRICNLSDVESVAVAVMVQDGFPMAASFDSFLASPPIVLFYWYSRVLE